MGKPSLIKSSARKAVAEFQTDAYTWTFQDLFTKEQVDVGLGYEHLSSFYISSWPWFNDLNRLLYYFNHLPLSNLFTKEQLDVVLGCKHLSTRQTGPYLMA